MLFLACTFPQATLQGKSAFIFRSIALWLVGLSSQGCNIYLILVFRADSPGSLSGELAHARNHHKGEGHQPAKRFNSRSAERDLTPQQSQSGQGSKNQRHSCCLVRMMMVMMMRASQILPDLQHWGTGGGYTIGEICRDKKLHAGKMTGGRSALGCSAFPAQGTSWECCSSGQRWSRWDQQSQGDPAQICAVKNTFYSLAEILKVK